MANINKLKESTYLLALKILNEQIEQMYQRKQMSLSDIDVKLLSLALDLDE